MTAHPAQPIRLQPHAEVAFAIAEQADPASLTDAQLARLDYVVLPVAVTSNQLVVAKFGDGMYRILGQISANPDATVQFTVWTPEIGSVPTVTPTPPVSEPTVTPTPPVSVPEPGTFALLIVGLLGVWRIFTRVTQQKQGGNSMNVKNLRLILFMYLLLSANIVAAARVTVVRIGTVNGKVEGEGFYCGYTCQKEYPENTVLQLKAIPEEGSRFIEWSVNGVKHEGTLRVNNEEMVVSARFEKLEWALPEFAVWWYEGNEVLVEFMALDEIVVHFDELQLQDEEQLQQAIEMVKQQFTAPVEIRDVEDFDDFWVWFQIPAITSFEEFKAISQRLKQLSAVKQVSPVLYDDLNEREDWMLPTGKIYIQYPKIFTETQIASFEAKYHLVRVTDQFSKMFIYYWIENPLETFERSRQIYESGLVIYAAPVLMHPVSLLNDESLKQDDPFLDAQWNFRGEFEHGGNVFETWALTQNDLRIKGNGVTIGIVESGGVYVDHEDLVENVSHEKSSQLNKVKKLNTVQKLPPDNSQKYHGASHGTATAGIAAGRGDNGIGISGVTPYATIIAYRSSSTAEDALTMHQADVDCNGSIRCDQEKLSDTFKVSDSYAR